MVHLLNAWMGSENETEITACPYELNERFRIFLVLVDKQQL
jgi:hypothetical protein